MKKHTFEDDLQLVSYNDLNPLIKVHPTLDSLLPKDDFISVEEASVSRYDHLKELIKINGITDPLCVAELNNEILLIDGLTRWGIAKKLIEEGHYSPDDKIFTVRLYKGFASLEEIMSWMISSNQSVRGAIDTYEVKRLSSIFAGIDYNNSKSAYGGNRGNQYTDSVLPSGELPTCHSLKFRTQRVSTPVELKCQNKLVSSTSIETLREYGKLATALEVIATALKLELNEVFYLYTEEGLGVKPLVKLSKNINSVLSTIGKRIISHHPEVASNIRKYKTKEEREEIKAKEQEAKVKSDLTALKRKHKVSSDVAEWIYYLNADIELAKQIEHLNFKDTDTRSQHLLNCIYDHSVEDFNKTAQLLIAAYNENKLTSVPIENRSPQSQQLLQEIKDTFEREESPVITKEEEAKNEDNKIVIDDIEFDDFEVIGSSGKTKQKERTEKQLIESVLLELDIAIRKMDYRPSLSKYATKFNQLFEEMSEELEEYPD